MMEAAAAKVVLDGAIQATPVLIPLFERAAEFIKKAWNNYGEEHMAEITAIQKYWTKHCYQQEKEKKDLNTLNMGRIMSAQNDISSTENVKLPIYLEMVQGEKFPVLFKRNFIPVPFVDDWDECLEEGVFYHEAKQMIGRICEYQRLRNETTCTGGWSYSYDPTNLFFEEFKAWLTKLSGVRISKEVLVIIQNRISYLDEIRNDANLFKVEERLFPPKTKFEPNRKKIIMQVQKSLENIKLLIKDQLQKVSAREDFEQLRNYIKFILADGIKFLFYVVRDNQTELPSPNFLIEEIRNPDLPSYVHKDSRLVILEKILQYLLNTPQFLMLFPKSGFGEEIIEFSLDNLFKNSFVTENNLLSFPVLDGLKAVALKERITLENWVSYEDAKNKVYSGISPVFRDKKLGVGDAFLRVCGSLQEICIFYLIIKEMRDLADEGGNLLIYKYAAKEVLRALEHFLIFNENFKTELGKLSKAAQNHKDFIDSNPTAKQKDTKWEEGYGIAAKAFRKCMEHVKNSEDLIAKIKSNHQRFNSKKYTQNLNNRIAFLCELLYYFCGYVPNPKQLPSSSGYNKRSQVLPSLPPPISTNRSLLMPPPKQDKEEEPSEHVNLLTAVSKISDERELTEPNFVSSSSPIKKSKKSPYDESPIIRKLTTMKVEVRITSLLVTSDSRLACGLEDKHNPLYDVLVAPKIMFDLAVPIVAANYLQLWDITNNNVVEEFPLRGSHCTLTLLSEYENRLLFASANSHLLSSGWRIYEWEYQSNLRPKLFTTSIRGTSFHDFHDGTILYRSYDKPTEFIVEDLNSRAISKFNNEVAGNAEILSKDFFVTTCKKQVTVWNKNNSHSIKTLTGHTDNILVLRRLSDTLFASGSWDTTIRIWDILTGKCNQILSGHEDVVVALALTPDNFLVSGSSDETVRIWNYHTGECLQTIQQHNRGVTALAVFPDGRIATGGFDGCIYILTFPELKLESKVTLQEEKVEEKPDDGQNYAMMGPKG